MNTPRPQDTVRSQVSQRSSHVTQAAMTDADKVRDALSSIAAQITENGRIAEESDRFAVENYTLLKGKKLFSALVPKELGGGGWDYPDMCRLLTELAACHPSTALSFSMHQHIVAANRYNHLNGRPGKIMLEKVSAAELALVSTGAGDWLASSGEMKKTKGGYLFSAVKHFASGSPAGDALVTSGPFEDPQVGWQVLHFPVPLNAEGVTLLDNWRAMGMRGTGSNSVRLHNVFVPEAAIAARRPRGDYHSMWSVILPVAMPLIMSVYRGIAETAAKKARALCRDNNDQVTPYLLGEMENALTTTQVIIDDLIRLVNKFSFRADLDTVNEVVKRKTLAAEACKLTTAKAVEVCGGRGFIRDKGIESLFRDSQAAHFHPLQEKRQLLFTGLLAMGHEPPKQAWENGHG